MKGITEEGDARKRGLYISLGNSVQDYSVREKNQEIKIYDISRIIDRIRAMKRGVTKTPTVIIDE